MIQTGILERVVSKLTPDSDSISRASTYIISIIDLHPFRHTISTVTIIAHMAPMIRQMPARTVRAVGTW